MLVETVQPKTQADTSEVQVRRNASGDADKLASSIWDSMKSTAVNKTAEPVASALIFHSVFQQTTAVPANARAEAGTPANRRAEAAAPAQAEHQGAKSDATKTKINADGGHTDTTTDSSGSTEAVTYDKNGKLVARRTDNPNGTYRDWKISASGRTKLEEKALDGSVRTRDDYPNGDFKDETKYKDGTRSLTSRFADGYGGQTHDKLNRDGSEVLTNYDSNGTLRLKYEKRADRSSTERRLDKDDSIVIKETKPDGSYVESKTDKSGTSRTVHTENKNGSSETKNYDSSGRLASERKTEKNGDFKETTYNADGTKTVRNENAKKQYVEQYFNAKNERISPTIAVTNASPEFVQKVKDEFAKMPEAIRNMITKNDGIIAITGKMSDFDPAWAKERPRGYEKGKTGDDSSGQELPLGQKDGKRIELAIIAEKTRAGIADDPEGTVRHEVGHMVDSILKDYSHGAAFKSAYQQDVAAMSAATKKDEKYFLQRGHKGRDGREEAFAEAVMAITGDPTEPRNAEVLARFPKVAALVRKRLSEIPK